MWSRVHNTTDTKQYVVCSSASVLSCWMWVSVDLLYPAFLLCVIIYNNTCLFSTGVKCEQLTQPDFLSVLLGHPLTITCKVSYSVRSYWTHWNRQAPGKGLEWIGRAASGSTPHYSPLLRNKFSISTDSSRNTVILTGQNVQPEDSAVYYCARDSQWHKTLVDLNKNHSVSKQL